MNQNSTRKGTREKKPSRYHYYEETESNAFTGLKNGEQKPPIATNKDRLTPAQQISQITKLFCKFLNATNMRYQDLYEAQQADQNLDQLDFPIDLDILGLAENKTIGGRSGRNTSHDPKHLRRRENGQLLAKDSKVASKSSKSKATGNGKTSSIQATSLDPGLNYHNVTMENLKNSFPNIQSLSSDNLREFSFSGDIQNKNQLSKSKPRDDKKVSKMGKNESKPFTRQSYHIAIAYNIYLQQRKNLEFVDPTSAARKLRQMTQKDGQ